MADKRAHIMFSWKTSMSMHTLILECSVHDIIFVPLKKLIQNFDFKLNGTCGLYLARKHSNKEAECSFLKKNNIFFTKYCFLNLSL